MNKLVMFTSSFPYGYKETYLETEIVLLAEVFDIVEIYPHYYNQGIKKRDMFRIMYEFILPHIQLVKLEDLFRRLKAYLKERK